MVNNPDSSSDSVITSDSTKSSSDSSSSTDSSHNDDSSSPSPPPVKKMLDYNVVLAIAIEKSRLKLEEENELNRRPKGFELERFPCLHFHSRRRR